MNNATLWMKRVIETYGDITNDERHTRDAVPYWGAHVSTEGWYHIGEISFISEDTVINKLFVKLRSEMLVMVRIIE